MSDVNVLIWATAISTNSTTGRKIFWRFPKTLHPAFATQSLPDRVIIVWKYESENGQPQSETHQGMNLLEDLLEPMTEGGKFATLALVSTGEGLREWTYYSKSADVFLDRFNALETEGEAEFPIELHAAKDPEWSMYKEFMTGLKEPS